MLKISLKIKDETLHILCEDIYLNVNHMNVHFPESANILDIIKMSLTFGFEFYKYADGHCTLTIPVDIVFNIKTLANV